MDKRILAKIKQCLALAKSASNEHEAAAALRSAQSLMRKHQLSDEDVGLSCVSEFNQPIEGSRIVSYHAQFLNVIRKAFAVEPIIKRGLFTPSSVSFVGITPQPELAAYCYEVLWTRLKSARSDYVKLQPKQCKRATKVARGDRFAEGWVLGVAQVVDAFSMSEKEARYMAAYMTKHHPNLTTTKPMIRGKKANTQAAGSDGFMVGKRESLHRPVDGQSQQKLSDLRG